VPTRRWIGADLRDVELYLELTSRPDAIEVGGLLTTPGSPRTATKIRDVVVIANASVPRKRQQVRQVEPADAPPTAANGHRRGRLREAFLESRALARTLARRRHTALVWLADATPDAIDPAILDRIPPSPDGADPRRPKPFATPAFFRAQ